MSAINASEVIAELNFRLNLPAEEAQEMVDTMINRIIPFDLEMAMRTAQLKKETSHLGLSLGDRACLALGMHLELPVYTADKIWQNFVIPSGVFLIR